MGSICEETHPLLKSGVNGRTGPTEPSSNGCFQNHPLTLFLSTGTNYFTKDLQAFPNSRHKDWRRLCGFKNDKHSNRVFSKRQCSLKLIVSTRWKDNTQPAFLPHILTPARVWTTLLCIYRFTTRPPAPQHALCYSHGTDHSLRPLSRRLNFLVPSGNFV